MKCLYAICRHGYYLGVNQHSAHIKTRSVVQGAHHVCIRMRDSPYDLSAILFMYSHMWRYCVLMRTCIFNSEFVMKNGVLLVSGRWRPYRLDEQVGAYRKHLVDPHDLYVMHTSHNSQMCAANLNDSTFDAAVRLQWNLQSYRVRTHLLTEEILPSIEMNLSLWKRQQLHNWYIQFTHIRQVFEFALQWRVFEYFIRARIDIVPTNTIWFDHSRLSNVIYGLEHRNGWSVDRKATIYSDWFYLTSRDGILALTNTSTVYINRNARCFAACPEEQVWEHVIRSRFSFVSINISMKKYIKTTWCA